MEWPAQSPDLNIIENNCLYMKRELQKSAVDIATKNDRLHEIQSGWRNIELDYIRNLYQSIPDPLHNVIKMKGHLTKYLKVILKLDLPKTVLKLARVNLNKRRHIESDAGILLVCVIKWYTREIRE